MTTANEEFADLMPHRIEVQGAGTGTDDYGQPVNVGEKRTYICLLDDTVTTKRSADGTEVTSAFTAYVAPVPLGMAVPVDISSSETVRIIDPYVLGVTVQSVERHYDSEDGKGMLHNIVLRFQ